MRKNAVKITICVEGIDNEYNRELMLCSDGNEQCLLDSIFTQMHGNVFKYEKDNDSIIIKGIKDKEVEELIIPKEIGGFPVKKIDETAFSGLEKLRSVIIPDSVDTIAGYAFSECSRLKNITIPDRARIDIAAFQNTLWLKEQLQKSPWVIVNDTLIATRNTSGHVTIPDGVRRINDVFRGCSDLLSVTIPDSVWAINAAAFSDCSSLTTVAIPDSVYFIGSYAFARCTGLTSVTIPNSVGIIGNHAFLGCDKLTDVKIPNSVEEIWCCAFSECTGLTNIVIPDSVECLEHHAFSECSNLRNIELSEEISTIDCGMFLDCSSLESVVIPDGVTSIEYCAFKGCSKLISISIPDSVTQIHIRAFEGCDAVIICCSEKSYARKWAEKNKYKYTCE